MLTVIDVAAVAANSSNLAHLRRAWRHRTVDGWTPTSLALGICTWSLWLAAGILAGRTAIAAMSVVGLASVLGIIAIGWRHTRTIQAVLLAAAVIAATLTVTAAGWILVTVDIIWWISVLAGIIRSRQAKAVSPLPWLLNAAVNTWFTFTLTGYTLAWAACGIAMIGNLAAIGIVAAKHHQRTSRNSDQAVSSASISSSIR